MFQDFQDFIVDYLLSGRAVVKALTVQEYELVGRSPTCQPVWVKNDAGGEEREEVNGVTSYAVIRYYRKVGDAQVSFGIDTNGVMHNPKEPKERCAEPLKRARLDRDNNPVYSYESYV